MPLARCEEGPAIVPHRDVPVHQPQQFDRVDNNQLATLAFPHIRTNGLHRKTADTFDLLETLIFLQTTSQCLPNALLRVPSQSPLCDTIHPRNEPTGRSSKHRVANVTRDADHRREMGRVAASNGIASAGSKEDTGCQLERWGLTICHRWQRLFQRQLQSEPPA